MASLQDQLLKAGLTDKKKVQKANRDKRKQEKVARKTKVEIVDETKVAAEQARKDKAEKARQINLENKAEADKKELVSQIKQLIQMNKIAANAKVEKTTKGFDNKFEEMDIAYSFVDGTKIKKMPVNALVQEQLINGWVSIAKYLDITEWVYEVVPNGVADKINQRDDSFVVVRNDKVEDAVEEDDPYADFQIPDDLMW
jgi:uncharacterized protein